MQVRRPSIQRLLACVVVAGAGVAPGAAQPRADRPSLTVGTAAAQRGQKASGLIEVPAGVDASTGIPVVVAHGARPGPVLAVVAGAHGTEYASIVAVERLIDLVDPSALTGSVILVPLVNVPSFQQVVPHLNPVDGKNMNRFYPGRADGTQTERASLAMTRQVVEQSDHLIDMHGGDLDESLRPYTYWTVTGRTPQDDASRAMAIAFGLDHIIISADRPADPAASRYLENTATTRGKPSITVEAGHAGTVEPEDVEALVQGTLSVLRHLGMLPGEPRPVTHPVWIDRLASPVSNATGIFYPIVKRGTYVERGMKIGYVTDYVGRAVSEVTAPEAGVLLYIRAVPSVTKGDAIGSIGVVKATR